MTADVGQLLGLVQGGWSRVRVLVVGDVMLDQYIWGQVARISPEAPVPVLRVEHRTERPGGAANVAMNLAGLGVRVVVAGLCGDDDAGRQLARLLEAGGVEARLVQTAQTPTISKTRILSGHQQMLRLDVEEDIASSDPAHDKLLFAATELAGGVDAIILSDYAKGTLTASLCRDLIRIGRERGIPVLVDPKGRDFERWGRRRFVRTCRSWRLFWDRRRRTLATCLLTRSRASVRGKLSVLPLRWAIAGSRSSAKIPLSTRRRGRGRCSMSQARATP